MHGHDNAWLDLADHLRGSRHVQYGAPRRDEQHVHGTDFVDLLGVQDMAQVAEVAEPDILHLDDVDRVAASLPSGYAIMEGSYPRDQHAPDFILTRTLNHFRIPTYHGRVIMAWVIVADRDNFRLQAQRRAPKGELVRIGDQRDVLAPQTKTTMAEKRNIHPQPSHCLAYTNEEAPTVRLLTQLPRPCPGPFAHGAFYSYASP